jgi:hypothetical protein
VTNQTLFNATIRASFIHMSIPDPVSTGIVTAGALQLAKQAQDFIAAASGHPGKSLGEILGDWSRRRIQNVEAVGNKARLILLNLGVEPKPVPLKVIQPLLDAASVEEIPEMQEVWANLLANAADPQQANNVLPSFVETLKDLGPRDAKFLDLLYRDYETAVKNNPDDWQHKDAATFTEDELMRVYAEAGLGNYPDLAEVLKRENAAFSVDIRSDRQELALILEVLQKHLILRREVTSFSALPSVRDRITANDTYHFTELGRRFVAGCRAPQKAE